jgi:aspartyl-tRNA(Asn)/glutamyl-tRNA(Gln) amidotransferase subunit C
MISKEDIKTLAELARLELSEAEVAGLQKDISNVLEYVGQLSSFQGDTLTPKLSKVSPLFNHNVMRADEPRQDNDPLAGKRESLLNALPKREGDYALVRKIIDKQSE